LTIPRSQAGFRPALQILCLPRGSSKWRSAILQAAAGLIIGSAGAAAQKPKIPAKPPASAKVTAATMPTGPSTLTGVYTNEQAGRGKNVYASSCRSCHSPQSHTGKVFNDWWRNHPLSDLFTFVATRMPKNDPGSLAPEDVADVVAYLLKMNAMPTGKDELYPDPDSLRKFRIETKRSAGSSTAKRTKP
jgi:mono/diheme cytochrome c family protein